jgi:hypothetical protein
MCVWLVTATDYDLAVAEDDMDTVIVDSEAHTMSTRVEPKHRNTEQDSTK